MKPEAAADALRQSIDRGRRELTIADAAVVSGLSLADAEKGLHALVAEYRGHLRVTDEGEILFWFPRGFEKPWVTTGGLERVARAIGRGLLGVARFVVRAWVSIVLVGYALVFLAILLALVFGTRSDRATSRAGGLFYPLFRLLGDALFWTFHPFSPFRVERDIEPVKRRRRVSREAKIPFYERVDRFFFGPKEEPPDPRYVERAVLAEIRARKGRIGLADVMRITGRPRDELDPLMSRLLADHEGSVEVSEEGGIAYRFPKLRKTATGDARPKRARAIWRTRVEPPPITGNPPGSNFPIAALNMFNLLMSGWMVAAGLTLERLVAFLSKVPLDKIPHPGLPIAFGVVPLAFSIALFLLPVVRLLWRHRTVRAAQRENGRRAVLRAVLEGSEAGTGVTEAELTERYRIAAGVEPAAKEITRHIVALGGDIPLDELEKGEPIRYRFQDLELEARAVAAEREAALDEEAKPGRVIFSSET